jgi:hypothetical protein
MDKRILCLMLLPVLVIALAGVSYGWQGRMGGIGDPFGLVADESDFLIHPVKIAKGEGVRFYGDYRFTYTGVTDWNYHLDLFTPAGVPLTSFRYDTSGQEFKHNALVGAGFPLGPGRMGLFFAYDGMRGDFDGHEDALATSHFAEYDLTKNFDNVALRLLYGLPVGGVKLGGEVQFAYRQDENKNDMPGRVNYILGTANPQSNLTPFQLPYDSKYWETLLKGSLEGKVGPLDLEFTLRGGFIFAGDNNFMLTQGSIIVHDGSSDVTGWRIGGDLWARYPLAKDLSLPFLVRLDYQSKTREGVGLRDGNANHYPYESQEQSLHLTIGGGVEKELSKGTRIAAGIYYNHLQGEYDITLRETVTGIGGQVWDHRGYPVSVENQVMLRLAGEFELSPLVTLRIGLVPFYGWVKEDFTFTYGASPTDKTALNGDHWGIGASLGGTIKFKPITLEPFVNFNYQQLKLDDDGGETTNIAGTITNLWEMDKTRNEWSIGGGFSILYDL